MPGTVIGATNLDSIRIEVLGEGRAITMPAVLLLAADRVLRKLGADTNAVLTVECDCPPEGPREWMACLHGKQGRSVTPWGAMQELAKKLEAEKCQS